MTKHSRSTQSTDSAWRTVSSQPATETRNDERLIVPYEEAVKRIGKGDRIHTFRNSNYVLIGADWSRKAILAAFKRYEVEETGPHAQAMKHGLAFSDDHGLVFVETVAVAENKRRKREAKTA